jgi:hypothetical protein
MVLLLAYTLTIEQGVRAAQANTPTIDMPLTRSSFLNVATLPDVARLYHQGPFLT